MVYYSKPRSFNNAWPPLTNQETSAIKEHIKALDLSAIGVLCVSPRCDEIADDFDKLFTSLGIAVQSERSFIAPRGISVAGPTQDDAKRIADAIFEGSNHRLKPDISRTNSALPYVSFGLLK